MQYPGKINPGDKFNYLTAIRFINMNSSHQAIWEFKCDCGRTITCRAHSVRSDNTKSCGCILKTANGLSGSPEYTAWICMKDRCYNDNREHYQDYGGRGIVVCDEWKHSFETFFADMGPRPSLDHSIDRIDVNGHYCKENCRRATRKEQQSNLRNNVWLMYKGRKMLQRHIAIEMGIEATTLRAWLKRGLTPDEIDVYYNSGKRWYLKVALPLIFKTAEFNGNFHQLIPHDNYVIVSVTDMGYGDVMYKLVAKGKPKDYAYLL